MSHFFAISLLTVAFFAGVAVGVQTSLSSLVSPSHLAVQTGPFEWVKKLLSEEDGEASYSSLARASDRVQTHAVPLKHEDAPDTSLAHTSSDHVQAQNGPLQWLRKRFSKQEVDDPQVHGPISKVVKLEIYYETRCPYCTSLFNQSVREIFNDTEFRERVDFHLYPFGNAFMIAKEDISEGYKFWHPDEIYPKFNCQHGDDECFANMIQACAIDELKTPDLYVPMTMCMAAYDMGYGIEKTSYECGESLGIDMHRIKECATSRTGSDILSAFGEETNRPGLNRTHVPYVVINGIHKTQADEGHLITPICAVLEDPKPELCTRTLANSKLHGKGCGNKGHC